MEKNMKITKEKILFITGTHGDEGFSRDVFRNLTSRYPKNKYGYEQIVGNPKALRQKVRYTQTDLNRSAPGNPSSDIYEERRAAQIINLSNKYKFVIDVHETIANCGIVTIIPYPTLQNIVLAAMLPIKKNVIWYTRSSLKKGPLVQFTDCPAIEIECGSKSSEQTKKDLEDILGKFLETRTKGDLDSLINNLRGKEFYKVYERLDEDGEKYTNFQLAKKGDEEFYPFMSGQYPDTVCYKIKKISFEDLFLI
jgi:hypothetical protein